jgi:peptidyl-prolyl cis-trans isomerase A (cyclophilin A)
MLLNFVLLALAQAPAAAPKAPATTPAVRPDGVYAVFDIVQGSNAKTATPMGKIVCKLYEKESPITVANFIGLATGTKPFTDPKTRQRAKRRLYDGLTFHRVIPGFMIQGGDPLGNGTGGTDEIKDEFDLGLRFDKPGVLAMANAGPNTGSSQFFITDGPTPHLNNKHTIFGQVVEGQELVAKIAGVPTGANDKPVTPVVMKRVSIERYPKPAPAAKPKPATTKPKPTTKPKQAASPAKKTP